MSKLMNCTDLKNLLSQMLPTKRYLHTIGVAETNIKLAKKFKLDEKAAEYIGLFHDAYRYTGDEESLEICENHNIDIDDYEREKPMLLHGAIAAIRFPEVVGEEPSSWFKALRYHTLSHKTMGKLGAILFVSDYIEPNRGHLTNEEKEEIFNLSSIEEMVKNILYREIEYSKETGREFASTSADTLNFLESGGLFD